LSDKLKGDKERNKEEEHEEGKAQTKREEVAGGKRIEEKKVIQKQTLVNCLLAIRRGDVFDLGIRFQNKSERIKAHE
jgi:hypothetical protein